MSKKKRKKQRVKVYIPQKPFYLRKGFICLLALLLVSSFGVYKVKAAKKTHTVKIKQSQKKVKEKETATFKKGVFKSDKAEIVFTTAESGIDYDKKEIVTAFFNITNLTKEPVSAQDIYNDYVEIYQDLGNSTRVLDRSFGIDSPFEEELDAINQTIKPGGTIEIGYAARLVDEDKPVMIRYKDGSLSDKTIGSMTVELEKE